jgi:hypothetical protein
MHPSRFDIAAAIVLDNEQLARAPRIGHSGMRARVDAPEEFISKVKSVKEGGHV